MSFHLVDNVDEVLELALEPVATRDHLLTGPGAAAAESCSEPVDAE